MLFRVRVDELNEETGSKLLHLFQGHEHVIVKHVLPHGNPHFHVYADMPMYMSCPAMRYAVDKMTGSKGPERSVKQCDVDRRDDYIQYLFNNKHDNISVLVSSTLDVTAHQAKAAAVSDEYKEAKTERKTKNEVTSWQLAEEVRQMYLAHDTKLSSEYDIYKVHVEYAIEVCRKHKKTFTDFSIQRIVQTAICADRKNQEQFVKNVLSKIFRT